ncbi:hypothetical protein C8C76_1211 [Halanaerobium saccharolyticum]|jgi:hypothetical protein|uniref:Uncharacterized protein n=1 Tax=Halanaerobium saccharolyticum TaxID=43595 RepID=A0A2T5RI79_9FIRM|nr:hypothetical protein C8C76_1211 [Halanaerobium saccharolyticum]TDP96020.1 hypothetical protein C7957_108108 [Halanaerobium saccharolyticum]
MRKFEKFVNEFAEIAAFGFGINTKQKNTDNDDYIDYLG